MIGYYEVNGRRVYAYGRETKKVTRSKIEFRDGSYVELNKDNIVNTNPELPLTLDAPDPYFKVPELPVLEARTYKSLKLKLSSLDRKVRIEPGKTQAISIGSSKGLDIKETRGVLTITEGEKPRDYSEVVVIKVNFMSIITSAIGDLANLINTESNDDLVIEVPEGAEITVDNCDDVEFGDTLSNVTIYSEDDVNIQFGKTGQIIFETDGDVTVEVSEARELNIKTSGDVDVNATTVHRDIIVTSDNSEVTVKLDSCGGDLTISASSDVSINAETVNGSLVIDTQGDADIRVSSCGDFRITDAYDVTVNAETVNGELTIKCSDDIDVNVEILSGEATFDADGEVDFHFESQGGFLLIDTTGDIDVTGKKLNGGMKVDTGDDISVRIEKFNGNLEVSQAQDLDINIEGGDMGSVRIDTDGDADVTIETEITEIVASVGGDGTFNIDSCKGRHKISADGDVEININ